MRRATSLGWFGTMALLASGCIDLSQARAQTPTTLDAQPVPRESLFGVPSQGEIASRWQLPLSNPWAAYEKLTLLSVVGGSPETVALPPVDDLDEVRLAERAAYRAAHDGFPEDAMWMIDLRGAASVAFGTTYSHFARGPTAIVPTFNNWPFEDELVPAEETLAAMIEHAPNITTVDEGAARPMFLLDSWRLAYKEEAIDDDVIDNRYMLSPADFPSPAKLREYGVRQVIYVVSSVEDDVYEEDDLNALFLSYQAAGITVRMVDLAGLARDDDATHRLNVMMELELRPFQVVPRATCVNDPLFYQRARGGFGGVHGAPTIWSPSYLAFGGGGHAGHGGG